MKINILLFLFFYTSFLQAQMIEKSGFIYETAPFPSCHASTIAETPQGIIAAWFGGKHEKNPDVGIWMSFFRNNVWSVPVEVANGVQADGKTRYPTWNPVLFQVPKGELLLFYKEGPAPDEWWGMLKRSEDGGLSWSKAEKLPKDIYGPIKNKPILLQNGTLLCPSSSEDHDWRLHIEFTKDSGKTWTRTEALNDGIKTSAIQPSILLQQDGRLQLLCRSENGYILQSFSSDLGKTWTDLEPTTLPNPNSGIDAVTLKDGRHLVVYNHVSLENRGRSPLNVAISEDGIHWKELIVLENEPSQEFSYPAIIQTSDGKVHITYTWKRKKIKHVILNLSK